MARREATGHRSEDTSDPVFWKPWKEPMLGRAAWCCSQLHFPLCWLRANEDGVGMSWLRSCPRPGSPAAPTAPGPRAERGDSPTSRAAPDPPVHALNWQGKAPCPALSPVPGTWAQTPSFASLQTPAGPTPPPRWGLGFWFVFFFFWLQQSTTNSYWSFSPAIEIKYGMESQHSYSIESNATLSNTNNSKQMSQRLEHYGLSIPVCPDPWNSLKVTLRLARTLL